MICAILIGHHLHPAQIRDGGKGQQRAGESKRPQFRFGVMLRKVWRLTASCSNLEDLCSWEQPCLRALHLWNNRNKIPLTDLNKKQKPIASKKTTVIVFTNKALVLELALPLLWVHNAQVSVSSHAQEVKGLPGFFELPDSPVVPFAVV